MSTAVSELFKTKPFPSWFSNHRIFKKIDKVKKIFPNIGLPNCEKEIDVDNVEPARAAADAFLKTVANKVSGRIDSLKEYILVDPDSLSADCFRKDDLGHWVLYPVVGGEIFEIPELQFAIRLEDLYENVNLGKAVVTDIGLES